MGIKDIKVSRILTIYSRLIQGEVVNKKEMANYFNVNEKTIQRDIRDIKNYFYDNRETYGINNISYSRKLKGYIIEKKGEILRKEDILAITKILLESRAFSKEELNHLTTAILRQVNNNQRKCIKEIIGNELFNYVPLKHNKQLLQKIWQFSHIIRNKEITQIVYIKTDGSVVERLIKPVAIIFSENYFYLIAYFTDFDSPTIFRIDRIKEYQIIGEKFYIPNSERFEDGEFRKRIQFMYTGEILKIKFEFNSTSIEAVLDRLPTARVLKVIKGGYIVEAEVYGKGIMMWILSQGSKIRVIEPEKFVDELTSEISKLNQIYTSN